MRASYDARWRALGDYSTEARRSLCALLYQRTHSTSSSIWLSLLVRATLSASLFLCRLSLSLCVFLCFRGSLSASVSLALLLASTSASATISLFASASARFGLGFKTIIAFCHVGGAISSNAGTFKKKSKSNSTAKLLKSFLEFPLL